MSKPGPLERGPLRRRLRLLKRRREALMLDLGALVLELHRKSRFLPDPIERRAAEARGVDAEVRALSEALGAGEGAPDLVAAGVAGNCDSCGAVYSPGARFCSQCAAELPQERRFPRRTMLGRESPESGEQVPRKDTRPRPERVKDRLEQPPQRTSQLPAGLLGGIAAGALVIVVGILLLSSGGDDEGGKKPERASQTPATTRDEPPPEDETVPKTTTATTPSAKLEPVDEVVAGDFDPEGDDSEHTAETKLAVDGNEESSWPTEKYEGGVLPKSGVGLTLSPPEAFPARGLDLSTTTPGFDVTIYGAEGDLPKTLEEWTEIASEKDFEERGRIALDAAGNDFAHYLIWITKIPAEAGNVEIAEAHLLR